MSLRLGCQTITWGEGQKNVLPTVFKEVAAAGFEGVEVGYRHIVDTAPEVLKSMLDDAGLVMISTHVGGNLENADQATGERSMLDNVLDYMNKSGASRLMYSGLRYSDADQYKRDLDSLSRFADKSIKRGVHLLYHNHDFEFHDGARVIKGLVEDSSPNLGWCPDVGWVHKAGVDIIPFLETIKTRIDAVHFKDFAAPGEANTFVCLGDGEVPFPSVAAWLRKNCPDVWVIAEQDQAVVPAAEAGAINGKYLQSVLPGGN